MKRLSLFAAALVATLGFGQVAVTDTAQADARKFRPNLMIMVHDEDPDTTPDRNQRIMSRIVGGMTSVLTAKGYNVYDVTAVTQDFVIPNNTRKAKATLIELARTVKQPPVDSILLIKYYASAKKATYNNMYRLDLRTETLLLSVKTGQAIDQFETEAFDRPVISANCATDRACILETVGKHGRVIGNDLANAISYKLDGYLRSSGVTPPSQDTGSQGVNVTVTTQPSGAPQTSVQMNNGTKPVCGGFPTGYTMTFMNFNDQEKGAIEEFLNAFSCVLNIRNLSSSATQHAFWYESSANDSVLRRNLRTMLEYMNVKAQMNFAGSKIMVTKLLSR